MDPIANCGRHKKMTEAAAKGAARALRNRKRFKGISAFKCRVGGEVHWHVGRGKHL